MLRFGGQLHTGFVDGGCEGLGFDYGGDEWISGNPGRSPYVVIASLSRQRRTQGRP
jgi:hypothetical protein